MEPKGSLPHLQEPATRPYPQPHKSTVDVLCTLHAFEVWHIWYGVCVKMTMGKVKQFLSYKRKLRLISNVGRVTSCRELFITLNTLPVLFTMSLNVVGDWTALHLDIW